MKFVTPKVAETFVISADGAWPSIEFATDGTGVHTWHWTLSWGSFQKSGKDATPNNKWNAKTGITNCGGTLIVRATAGAAHASMTVKITGTNPKAAEVIHYLSTKANSAGFGRIIQHETKFKHFGANGEPVKSFDGGYGMCQLTFPAPTFEQVWNWKLNVDGGLKLFGQKHAAAVAYLSQTNRAYTADQLKRETVCRWNGGAYHEWDSKAGRWVRSANVLCDSKTGNIGWDMTDSANKGKTEAELHKRDGGSYATSPQAGAHWKYSGMCYADRILD